MSRKSKYYFNTNDSLDEMINNISLEKFVENQDINKKKKINWFYNFKVTTLLNICLVIFLIILIIYLLSPKLSSQLLICLSLYPNRNIPCTLVNDYSSISLLNNLNFYSMIDGPIIHDRYEIGQLNDRPIIGVLTQPITFDNGTSGSFFSSTYPRWLESSGARVVPILYDTPKNEIIRLMNQLNGILFVGGNSALIDRKNPYYDTSKIIFDHVKELNDNHIYYPLWGTCLGMQQLAILVSGDNHTLLDDITYNTINMSLPLLFKQDAEKSILFSNSPKGLRTLAESKPLTVNEHRRGISMELFNHTKALNSFFNVITTSIDPVSEIEFISTMEAKNYPIFGVQWHPEKTSFEHGLYRNQSHSRNAVELSQYISNEFVYQARMNQLSFKSMEYEIEMLVYNFDSRYNYYSFHDGFLQNVIYFPSYKELDFYLSRKREDYNLKRITIFNTDNDANSFLNNRKEKDDIKNNVNDNISSDFLVVNAFG